MLFAGLRTVDITQFCADALSNVIYNNKNLETIHYPGNDLQKRTSDCADASSSDPLFFAQLYCTS